MGGVVEGCGHSPRRTANLSQPSPYFGAVPFSRDRDARWLQAERPAQVAGFSFLTAGSYGESTGLVTKTGPVAFKSMVRGC